MATSERKAPREIKAWLCWFDGDDLTTTILADAEERAAEIFAEVRGAGTVRVADAAAAQVAMAATAAKSVGESLTWVPIRVERRSAARLVGVRVWAPGGAA